MFKLILSDYSKFKTLTDNEFEGMRDKIIFDTKNIVKNDFNNTQYYNYGNLYTFSNRINVKQ
ncbi:hypothetical protein [Mammaliicoccus lentus]|uniref:hypothetical protein n=1 Tax=Mammaliicoccus lentus TaxID=42858 RepID=UPI003A599ACF